MISLLALASIIIWWALLSLVIVKYQRIAFDAVFLNFFKFQTIKTNVIGTLNMLGLAKRVGARLEDWKCFLTSSFWLSLYSFSVILCRILLTSTSEVYGDPLVHPQPESYWGNVNPIGTSSYFLNFMKTSWTLTFFN